VVATFDCYRARGVDARTFGIFILIFAAVKPDLPGLRGYRPGMGRTQPHGGVVAKQPS
jgi:hypothetical protein